MLNSLLPYSHFGCEVQKLSTSSNVLKVGVESDILVTVGNQIKIVNTLDHTSKTIHADLKCQKVLSVALSSDFKFIGILAQFPLLIYGETEVKCIISNFDRTSNRTIISFSEVKLAISYEFSSLTFSSSVTYVAVLVKCVNKTNLKHNNDVSINNNYYKSDMIDGDDGIVNNQPAAMIFDRKSGQLKYVVPVFNIHTLLFCPNKEHRFFTIGKGGIQLWRLAQKEVQSIPIVDSEKLKDYSFTCLAWINNDTIIVGTSTGQLVLICGNSLLSTAYNFFDTSDNDQQVGFQRELATLTDLMLVQHILVKGDIVIVLSNCNKLTMFEFCEVSESSVTVSARYELRKLYQVQIANVHIIYGAAFINYQTNVTTNSNGTSNSNNSDGISINGTSTTTAKSDDDTITSEADRHRADLAGKFTNCFDVVVACDEFIGHVFIPHPPNSSSSGDSKKNGSSSRYQSTLQTTQSSRTSKNVQIRGVNSTKQDNDMSPRLLSDHLQVPLSSSLLPPDYDIMERINLLTTLAADSEFESIRGTTIKRSVEHIFFPYHTQQITSMALSHRTATFLTSSTDGTIKMWNYATAPKHEIHLISQNVYQDYQVMPSIADLHPSGHYCSVGCADEVCEYAITDSKYELLRRINVKRPFVFHGVPFANTHHPVSLLRYSHSGHWLAAVTGRMVQVFDLTKNHFTFSEPTGYPVVIMAITDHKSNILDVIFTHDDRYIYSCSVDGTVFCHDTQLQQQAPSQQRCGDYFAKKRCTNIVLAVSTTSLFIAAFTVAATSNTPASPLHPNMNSSTVNQSNNDFHFASGSVAVSGKPIHSGSSISVIPVGGLAQSSLVSSNSSVASASSSAVEGMQQGSTSANNVTSVSPSYFIACWDKNGSVELNKPIPPVIVYTDYAVTSMSFSKLSGTMNPFDGADVVILGLSNGQILISKWPVVSIVCLVVAADDTLSNSIMPKTPKYLPQPQLMMNTDTSNSVSASDSVISVMSNTSRGGGAIELNTNSNIPLSKVAVTTQRHRQSVAKGDDLSLASSSHPIPLRRASSATVLLPESTSLSFIDVSTCLIYHNHSDAIITICVTETGQYLFAASADGSVSMYSTLPSSFYSSSSATAPVVGPPSAHAHTIAADHDHTFTSETSLVLTKRSYLEHMKSELADVEYTLMLNTQDCEGKLLKSKKMMSDYLALKQTETTKEMMVFKKSIEDEKEKILAEYILYQSESQDTISALKKELSDRERFYEKRLYNKTNALVDMKQSYNEIATQVKLKHQDDVLKLKLQESTLTESQNKVIHEVEVQKSRVMEIEEKLNNQAAEVTETLTATFKIESDQLLKKISELTAATDTQANTYNLEIKKLNKDIGHLKLYLKKKYEEITENNEKANFKYDKLETEYKVLVSELNDEKDKNTALEAQIVEILKEFNQMEKIRHYLSLQVEELKAEQQPRVLQYEQTSSTLNHLNKNYEELVEMLNERNKNIEQISTRNKLLQKQVMETRYGLSHKDTSLKRLAKLYSNYVTVTKASVRSSYNTSLISEAQNKSTDQYAYNTTNNANRIANITKTLETIILKKDQESINSLVALITRLDDILTPYIRDMNKKESDVYFNKIYQDEDEAALEERERHVALLHRSLEGVQDNLRRSHVATSKKLRNQISDNLTLLYEVDTLRHENQSIETEKNLLESSLKYIDKAATRKMNDISANVNIIAKNNTQASTGKMKSLRKLKEIKSALSPTSTMDYYPVNNSSDKVTSSFVLHSDIDDDVVSADGSDDILLHDDASYINFVRGLQSQAKDASNMKNTSVFLENKALKSSIQTAGNSGIGVLILGFTTNPHTNGSHHVKDSKSAEALLPNINDLLVLHGSQTCLLSRKKSIVTAVVTPADLTITQQQLLPSIRKAETATDVESAPLDSAIPDVNI